MPKLSHRLHNGRREGMVVAHRHAEGQEGPTGHARIPAHQPSARLPDLRQGRRVRPAGFHPAPRARRQPLRPAASATSPSRCRSATNILLDRERCIACQRCVRFCQDVAMENGLVMQERGFKTEVGVEAGCAVRLDLLRQCGRDVPGGRADRQELSLRDAPVGTASAPPASAAICSVGCNVRLDVRVNKADCASIAAPMTASTRASSATVAAGSVIDAITARTPAHTADSQEWASCGPRPGTRRCGIDRLPPARGRSSAMARRRSAASARRIRPTKRPISSRSCCARDSARTTSITIMGASPPWSATGCRGSGPTPSPGWKKLASSCCWGRIPTIASRSSTCASAARFARARASTSSRRSQRGSTDWRRARSATPPGRQARWRGRC